jgi:hypothetical protein
MMEKKAKADRARAILFGSSSATPTVTQTKVLHELGVPMPSSSSSPTVPGSGNVRREKEKEVNMSFFAAVAAALALGAVLLDKQRQARGHHPSKGPRQEGEYLASDLDSWTSPALLPHMSGSGPDALGVNVNGEGRMVVDRDSPPPPSLPLPKHLGLGSSGTAFGGTSSALWPGREGGMEERQEREKERRKAGAACLAMVATQALCMCDGRTRRGGSSSRVEGSTRDGRKEGGRDANKSKDGREEAADLDYVRACLMLVQVGIVSAGSGGVEGVFPLVSCLFFAWCSLLRLCDAGVLFV